MPCGTATLALSRPVPHSCQGCLCGTENADLTPTVMGSPPDPVGTAENSTGGTYPLPFRPGCNRRASLLVQPGHSSHRPPPPLTFLPGPHAAQVSCWRRRCPSVLSRVCCPCGFEKRRRHPRGRRTASFSVGTAKEPWGGTFLSLRFGCTSDGLREGRTLGPLVACARHAHK